MARSHTIAVKKAVAARDWRLAEQIIHEDMRGAHARNWLRRIERMREDDLICRYCGNRGQQIINALGHCEQCGSVNVVRDQ